jgi:hypothetical protein
LGDLLYEVVIDVRVSDDLPTPSVGIAEHNLDGLLVVRDLLL